MNGPRDRARDGGDPAAYLIAGTIAWLADGTTFSEPHVGSAVSDDVLAIVRGHGLLPALYSALLATDKTAGLRYPFLRKAYLASAARAAVFQHDARECLSALNDAGVVAMPLKGNDYALRLYRDPAHRIVSDMDLLIQESQVEQAVRALGRLGYVRQVTSFSQEDEWLSVRYLGGFLMTRGRDLPMDLHTNVLRGYGDRDRAVDQVWREARRCTVSGDSVQFLRFEHAFIISAVHLYSNWTRTFPYLKDAADLVLLARAVERQGDWGRVWEDAATWGVGAQVASVVAMLNRDLGARIPECAIGESPLRFEELVHARQRIRNPGRIGEGLSARLRLMRHLRGPAAKVRYLIGFVLPRPEYLRWRFGCDETVPLWKLRLRHLAHGSRQLARDLALRHLSLRR